MRSTLAIVALATLFVSTPIASAAPIAPVGAPCVRLYGNYGAMSPVLAEVLRAECAAAETRAAPTVGLCFARTMQYRGDLVERAFLVADLACDASTAPERFCMGTPVVRDPVEQVAHNLAVLRCSVENALLG